MLLKKRTFFHASTQLLAMLCVTFGTVSWGVANPHLFVTGPVHELDRCASVWLIKRYVDPEAVFEIHPENELVTRGIAFDIPVAELRRTHKMSTFETIADRYDVVDSKIAYIGRLTHEREINFLAASRSKESFQLERDVQQVIDREEDSHTAIQFCLQFFDDYIETIQK